MPLLDDLASGDEARAQAALARVTLADAPALVAAAGAAEVELRCWALAALGGLATREALSALLAASVDPDPEVRAAALHALGRAESDEAVMALLFALHEPGPYLARLAADGLIRQGARAVLALCEALDRETEGRVRLQLARALAQIGDPRAIPALFRALEDDSAVVQYWAEHGLDQMGAGQVYFNV